MAQAVTRWPFTAETRARSLVKSNTGTGVSLSSTVFPCQYESNNAQYPSSKLFLTKDKRVNPRDLPTKVTLFRQRTIFKTDNKVTGTGTVYTYWLLQSMVPMCYWMMWLGTFMTDIIFQTVKVTTSVSVYTCNQLHFFYIKYRYL
jgi:hypothetical protein